MSRTPHTTTRCALVTIVLLAPALPAGEAGADLSSPAPTDDARFLVVKFRDGTAVHWSDGAFRDRRGRELGIAAATKVSPVFEKDPAVYAAERERARREGFGERRHLELYYSLRADDATHAARLLAELRADPRVESAYVPKRAPPSPASGSPDFSAQQRYLGGINGGILPAYTPVRARYLWEIPGGTGAGVRFVDIEYAWNLSHEDFPAVTVLGPTPRIPSGLNAAAETHHGTAGLGVVLAQHNGIGIDGIAPAVDARVAGSVTDLSAAYEVNIARAIDRARTFLRAGDVLLLEAQIGGPNWTNPSSQVGLVPVEWQQVVFDAIRAAADQGIIVVEAAGNGQQDLDDAVYQSRFDRATRDSGALIVTSVLSTPPVPGQPNVSNFGSRVDLYYWQEPIVTTGYGDLQDTADDSGDYSQSSYSSSSAASAIVAGGICALEGMARALLGAPLSLARIRDVLASTGDPNRVDSRSWGVRPYFSQAAYNVASVELEVNTLFAGAVLNPSFEITHGAVGQEGNVLDSWENVTVPRFPPLGVTTLGSMTPLHKNRMLLFEERFSDQDVFEVAGGFTVPYGAEAVTFDWSCLSGPIQAGDPCEVTSLSIDVVDPATGDSWNVAAMDQCLGMSDLGAAAGQYTRSSGWRRSHFAGLAGLEERYFEIRARIGGLGTSTAALLMDGVRFGSLAAPSLAGISPARGSQCGGTQVTVRGTNLSSSDTQVLVGGNPLASVRWIDAETVVGETPPGTAGAAVVELTSPRGNASLGAAFSYETAACGGRTFQRGDCNDDGVVDISDVIFSLNFKFRGALAPACEKSCDANDDGVHDISDPIFELGYLFGGGAAPSAPFPACGADPTADALACAVTANCP